MFTKHKRITDRKMIQKCRKSYCEYGGEPASIEPHHVFTVGAGGGDIKENLVQLCTKHHIQAHSGEISKEELLGIIARREGMTVDEVSRVNRIAKGYKA